MPPNRPGQGLTHFTEDSFDLAAHKKGANVVTRAKQRLRRARWLIWWGKLAIMVASAVVFMVLFWMAMEIIARFT